MLERRDYTIALICALSVELAAAQAMLDEEHDGLPRQPNDSNTYTLGRMGKHNVVIACLPSGIYGTVSCATVASELRFSFPSVRFGLMVGIAGGVPDQRDIRLGDVVVSQPSGTSGGVIQYDLGKTIGPGKFNMTGQLDRPPTVLLTAISQLQARHLRDGIGLQRYIAAASERFPNFRQNCERPGQDHLFEAEYEHPDGNATCDLCDASHLVVRSSRKSKNPIVHYGLIASGNQVIKHARLRSELGRKLNILCFEMEAAGLMNSFPCLAIRGICDYADSHKHKIWQPYAAVVAAAYARDLLDVIPIEEVIRSHLVTETIESQAAKEIALYRPRPTESPTKPTLAKDEWEVLKGFNRNWPRLLARISDHDPEIAHWRLSKQHLPNTGKWFLEHPHVKRWIESASSRSLWCSGGVGSGKTMLCAGLIDYLKSVTAETSSSLIYFYCETSKRKTADYVLRSLIKQLLQSLLASQIQCPEEVVTRIEEFFNPASPEPDVEDIKTIFLMLASAYSGAIYLIDGLDELEDSEVRAVLYALHHLLRNDSGPKVFISSRDELGLNVRPAMDLRVQISSVDNEADILQYITQHTQMESIYGRPLSTDADIMTKIKQVLVNEACGMFLWVRLQIEALWLDCINDKQILSALDTLPRDLPSTYDRCAARMPLPTKDVGIKVLRWVSSSMRDLTIHELQEAVSFNFTDTSWDRTKLIAPSILMASCANLISFDHNDQTVRLAHPTVKQYLFESLPHGSSRLHFDVERTVLECGEDCVNYLSFLDFSSQLQKAPTGNSQIRLSTPAAVASTLPLHRLASKVTGLFGSRASTAKPTLPPLESWLPKSEPRAQTSYSLLDYARQNWALQTRLIDAESKVWDKFVALALQLGDSWKKQPWRSSTLSYMSHLHGLLIWASRERHMPLLKIVLKEGATHGIKNFCDLPCVSDGLPALHIASRLGYEDVVKSLLKTCDVNASGPASATPLHFAVEKHHEIIIYLLLSVEGLKLSSYRLSAPAIPFLGNVEVKETPLGIAALKGRGMIVRLLLKHGALILPDEVEESNPFLAAAHGCHADIFQTLLDESINRYKDKDKIMTASLELALRNCCSEIVRMLLDQTQVDVNNLTRTDEAPLNLALANRDLISAGLLLRCPQLDVDCTASKTWRAPLSVAAEHGYEQIVRQLLAKKASVDMEDIAWRTPLSYAAENGHVDVMKQLLNAGAKQKMDMERREPLSFAAEHGHTAAVELLLSDGSNHNLDGGTMYRLAKLSGRHYRDWRSPIALAAEGGHVAVVKLLLEHGANAEIHDNGGRTPLSYAAGAGQVATVTLLLQKNADARTINHAGRAPLSFAAEGGHEAVVRQLLEKSQKDYFGRTPLSYAAEHGHEGTVELLLGIDEQPGLMDESRRCPLSYAAQYGHEAVVSQLLGKESGSDAGDKAKALALSYAAENGHEPIVKLLLQHGADPETHDWHRRKTLYYATKQGHEAIRQLLIESGANTDLGQDIEQGLYSSRDSSPATDHAASALVSSRTK